MTKDIVKKAIGEAEQELQQEEVNKIKAIVKKHLEKINDKQKQKAKLEEEIKYLKKDLEDMKAGRLDMIEERHETDEKAREIRIIEIHKIEKEYIPMRPWYSPYQITWAVSNTGYSNCVGGTITTGTGSMYLNNAAYTTTSTAQQLSAMNTGYSALSQQSQSMQALSGKDFQNFTKGSYEINGQVINL